MKEIFVAGTDTNVGKTFVSRLLLKGLQKYCPVTYYKPIQAGSPTDFDEIESSCTEVTIKQSTYNLKWPASPDRSAAKESVTIEIDQILQDWQKRPNQFHIVEGAGGLMVPINENEEIIDLIQDMKIPCVLVASTKLGTINHTLLSARALQSRSIPILGLILNGPFDDGLAELLSKRTDLPILFEVPAFENTENSSLEKWMSESDDFRGCIDFLLQEHSPLTTATELKQLDQEFVWHPFTQHGIVKNHPVVTSAQGTYLQIGNHRVIDGISSWWVNLLGHGRPEIVEAIAEQTRTLEHVLFAGFSHEPAIQLSRKLIQTTRSAGAELDKVFFSDNGSTAVEVALKMAYQFHQISGNQQRTKFLAFYGSYHGDTLGAMSVGERKGFNEVFQPLLFDVDYVDPFDLDSIEKAFETNGEQYAAVIFEPMVQGASGMRMYGSEVLDRLQALCQTYSVFKICDEVFTGFYRTGKLFGFEHSDLRPDFLCLSKGLTGGFLPLATTLTNQKVFRAFEEDDMRKAFLHGHSYTANPIACAAANATLDLLKQPAWQEAVANITRWTQQAVSTLMNTGLFFNGRSLGTIGALEINNDDPNYFKGNFSYRFNQMALQKGVLLRPLGGTIYAVPPLCSTEQEIEKIYKTMEQVKREEF